MMYLGQFALVYVDLVEEEKGCCAPWGDDAPKQGEQFGRPILTKGIVSGSNERGRKMLTSQFVYEKGQSQRAR